MLHWRWTRRLPSVIGWELGPEIGGPRVARGADRPEIGRPLTAGPVARLVDQPADEKLLVVERLLPQLPSLEKLPPVKNCQPSPTPTAPPARLQRLNRQFLQEEAHLGSGTSSSFMTNSAPAFRVVDSVLDMRTMRYSR